MLAKAIHTIHYTVPGDPGVKVALPGSSFEIDDASFAGLETAKAAYRLTAAPIVYPDTATMIAAGYRAGALTRASDYGTPASDEAIAAADVADKAKAQQLADQLAADELAATEAAAKLAADKTAADAAAADAADKSGAATDTPPVVEDHIG